MTEQTNLGDVPRELYPMILGYAPKLIVKELRNPPKVCRPMRDPGVISINCEIEYINHFANMELCVCCTNDRNVADLWRDNINNFINKIKMGIPCKFQLLNCKEPTQNVNHIALSSEVSYNIKKNFVSMSVYEQNGDISDDDTIISYTGKNYEINNIVLALDGHQFICDLLDFIAQYLLVSEDIDDIMYF